MRASCLFFGEGGGEGGEVSMGESCGWRRVGGGVGMGASVWVRGVEALGREGGGERRSAKSVD